MASTNHADLPAFMMGHSMGGLCVASFLTRNNHLAEKLSGVIYSAPLMGMKKQKTNGEMFFVGKMAESLDEMVLCGGLECHKICRNKTFVRQFLLNRKANPFCSASFVLSLERNIALIHKHAEQVKYPHLLVLGDKDSIVENSKA